MTNTKKIVYGVGAIIVVLIGVLIGKSFGGTAIVPSLAGAVGDTNTTPRMIQIQVSLASTTIASLSNPGNDRLITSVEYYLTGLTTSLSNATGLTNLIFTLSTSTDVYTAASLNYVLNTSVATTTSPLFVSTSTPGMTASVPTRIWGAGTNLNLFQNGTSTATGYIIVHYRQL